MPLLYELGKGLVAVDLTGKCSYGKAPFDIFLQSILDCVPGLRKRKQSRFSQEDPRSLVGEFQRFLLKHLREHGSGKTPLPSYMADNATNFLLSVWRGMTQDSVSYTDVCRMYTAIGAGYFATFCLGFVVTQYVVVSNLKM